MAEPGKSGATPSDFSSVCETMEDMEDFLPFNTPETITVFYKVVATPKELERIEETLDDMGICFERREP